MSDNNQIEFERIEAFLLGNLNSNELATFQSELKNNSELQKKVDEIKVLIDSVEEKSMQETLDKIHNDNLDQTLRSSDKMKPMNSVYRKFAVAASLAVVFGLAAWLLFFQSSSGDKIFANHFELDPGIATTMGSNTEYDLYKGMIDYKQGNFDIAIKRWEALAEIDPQNDTINYYLGVSYLATNEFDKAKYKLETALTLGDGNYNSEINLYLGLIEIKKDNLDSAKEYLQKSETNKAKEVLSELK